MRWKAQPVPAPSVPQMLQDQMEAWRGHFSRTHQTADVLRIKAIADTVAPVPELALAFIGGGLAVLPDVARNCPHTGEVLLASLLSVAVRTPVQTEAFFQGGLHIWPELTRAHAPTSRLLGETLLHLAGEDPAHVAAVMKRGLEVAPLFPAPEAKTCITLVEAFTHTAGAGQAREVPGVGHVWREIIVADRSPMTNMPVIVIMDSTNRENAFATVLEGGIFRGPFPQFCRFAKAHLVYDQHMAPLVREVHNALACPEMVPSLFPHTPPSRGSQNRNGMERVTL